MKAKSISGNSPKEIKSALAECMADGFRPTLAIVFLSIKQDREAICDYLNKEGITIFGATTSGEFISREIGEGSIAIMLLNMNPSNFKVLFLETSDSTVLESSIRLGAEGKNVFSKPAFIVASGWLHTDGEEIVKGIVEGFGSEVTVFGGMAGDDLILKGPLVFNNVKKQRKRISSYYH